MRADRQRIAENTEQKNVWGHPMSSVHNTYGPGLRVIVSVLFLSSVAYGMAAAQSARPSPPARACNGIATCQAACEGGGELACRRLRGFAQHVESARQPAIYATLTRACAGPAPRICLALVYLPCAELETDTQTCNERRLELLHRACAAGEGAACEDLVDFTEGETEAQAAAWRAQGASLMRAQCEASDYLACAVADVPLDGGDPLSRRFRARITRACERERDALACFLFGELLGSDHPDAPRWMERGCAAADADVCPP